jgi:hypothetical protein
VTLAKVSPGQPLRIPAETFNAFVDAAVAYQASRTSRQAEGGANLPAAGIVTVRNDSGADQDRFAVLGIGSPLILPTENAAAFQERVAMAVVAPDKDTHVDRICILQEPVAAGKLGRGLILGVTPVRLDVQAEDDRVAAVVTGETGSLKTGITGVARILWKESGTGEVWGIVQIPAGGGDALPEGQALDTLRIVPDAEGNPVPTFQAVLAWGQIAVRSPSHSLDGLGEATWVTPTTDDGALFDPAPADADGFGSTVGFYASRQDGIDIGIEKNVGADVPGMHNPDDLEIHIRLAPQEGPGVLGVTAGGDAQVPRLVKPAEGLANGALLVLDGTLSWGLIPTAAIANGAVTNDKIASVHWSKITNVPPIFGGDVFWADIKNKPLYFPPEYHIHDLAGAIEGTTENTTIAAGAVTSEAIADGAVTPAKLAVDFLTIGGVDWHLGDAVTGLMTNPMTGVGDLIIGGADGEPLRLPGNQGGTLQILVSKNQVTSLVSHVLDALEDVTITSPKDQEVLTFDAATGEWKNAAGGSGGGGGNLSLVAQIGAKQSGNVYAVTCYPQYPSTTPAWSTTATQLQGDPTKTIPAGTWTLVCANRKSAATGFTAADYDCFMQVPVWL